MSTPRGKIGRLPYDIRCTVNEMIRDNVSHEVIIGFLDTKGHYGVIPQNVSAWKNNGYRKWQRHQQRIEDMRSRRERSREMLAAAGDEDALTLESNEAASYAVDIMAHVLEEFDADRLKDLVDEDPKRFMDIVTALDRLRRSDQSFVKLRMEFEAYKRRVRELAEEAREKAAAGGGSEDLAALADAMDQVLSG